MARWHTLIDLVRDRADANGDDVVYEFVAEPRDREARLAITAKALDRRARAVAAALVDERLAGERVLIQHRPGLEYVSAFLGCVYAGAVAVPAYPSRPGRSDRRLDAVIADAQPKAALAGASGVVGRGRDGRSSALAGVPRIRTGEVPDEYADRWRGCDARSDAMAYLQYTSGSTTAPRGVKITHGNLLANLAALDSLFALSPSDRSVVWLPPFHDMGLVGGLLAPLFSRFAAVVMAPEPVLQQPALWLQTISRSRATISGGPNFAYELCVRNIRPDQCDDIDLSSWRVAFNGAEPIQAATLRRFATRFAPAGFAPNAFYPCYGLAESTLVVSAGRVSETAAIHEVSSDALAHGRLAHVDASAESSVASLAGSGRVAAGTTVAIIDPSTSEPCERGRIGEIWVRGPSIADGYWNVPDNDGTFAGFIAGTGEGPYLRTGDLGAWAGPELVVTGRLKDLVIIRGRNYYPQDLEYAVASSNAAIRSGAVAAFSVPEDNEEQLVVIYESKRTARGVDHSALAAAIRRAVTREFDIAVSVVGAVPVGSIPKTSSGKLQRAECRARYLAGDLPLIAADRSSRPTVEASTAQVVDRDAVVAMPAAARHACVANAVIDLIVRHGHLMRADVDPSAQFAALGFDSLAVAELQQAVNEHFDIVLPGAMSTDLTPNGLSARVLTALEDAGEVDRRARVESAALESRTAEHLPLTVGQQAIWFLHQLAPQTAVHNIARAMRIDGRLDVGALNRAFAALVARHAALRTAVEFVDARPAARVRPAESPLALRHARDWSEARLRRELDAEGCRPFDLSRGSLMRATLYQIDVDRHVLLSVLHHLAGDFWSFAILFRDLRALYEAETSSAPVAVAAPRDRVGTFARQQQARLAGPEGERLWSYWRSALDGRLPVLALPTDRPRPRVLGETSEDVRVQIPRRLGQRIRDRCRAHACTPYVFFLAAYYVWLHRYTGQRDLLVGSPVLGRTDPGLADTVGLFMNPLPLRAAWSSAVTFDDLLTQTHGIVRDALQHQAFPFATLVERLQPERDLSRPPLFQTMFQWYGGQRQADLQLGALALGVGGTRLSLGDATAESIEWRPRTTQLELTLSMGEVDGGFVGVLSGNADLFEPNTIRRFARHWTTLLASIVAAPDVPVSRLPLLAPAERRELVSRWNATAAPIASETVPEMIERHAARNPRAVAVCGPDGEWTYGSLIAAANRIARWLADRGCGAETVVGVSVSRGARLLAAVLGILKSGAAYLPLDPSYPTERLQFMITDAGAKALIADRGGVPALRSLVPCVHEVASEPTADATDDLALHADPAQAAYVIYTSGSTGRPKGVAITHRNLMQLCRALDDVAGCTPADTVAAMTSLSFDISVVELLYPLTRGARVLVVGDDQVVGPMRRKTAAAREMRFSLFYFSSDAARAGADKYQLLRDGARFADEHGFDAIWTPERHFHSFGGLFPNPSVLGAAIAATTSRVRIRAGSVVVPLHDVLRIAEEWSVVDNLSHGRVDIACASGWHPNDFALRPDAYADRREVTYRGIDTLRRLWRGETIPVRSGDGREVSVAIWPRPIQPDLPIWITTGGSLDTWIKAGEIGGHVLTHLLGQRTEDLQDKIRAYRQALAAHGHDPAGHRVTLMLHTYLDRDAARALDTVREPFLRYLDTSVDLIATLARSLDRPFDPDAMSASDRHDLLVYAFNRYARSHALFGTVDDCFGLVDHLRAIGVDEIASLVDFGVDAQRVMASLPLLAELKERANAAAVEPRRLADTLRQYAPTLMQCTPTLARLLADDEEIAPALRGLRLWLVGGEALDGGLAAVLKQQCGGRVVNMYGPTETTVWSLAHEVTASARGTVPIGWPLVNTRAYVVDEEGEPVPIGVCGEVVIGGAGVGRGYWGRRDLTATKFQPDRFGPEAGARVYATGDLGRYRADGTLEFLGRRDHQVKLRGFRIELDEIEAVLRAHASVRDAAVVLHDVAGGRLVAYAVQAAQAEPVDASQLRRHLAARLLAYMVPSDIVFVPALPTTANGKIDRRALPIPAAPAAPAAVGVMPSTRLETQIATIWQRVLERSAVGIHDNFFDLGGHSLAMAHVHSELQQATGQQIPLMRLFEHPTISSLADHLSRSNEGPEHAHRNVERAEKQRAALHAAARRRPVATA